MGGTLLRIRVAPEVLVDKPVNPLLYGNFIESGIGRQVDGMWAELLSNRSVEPVAPYTENTLSWLGSGPGDDLSGEDWWHSGYEEHAWYLAQGNPDAVLEYRRLDTWKSDAWGFCHGIGSAALNNRSQTQRAYLAQDGIYLKRGMDYLYRGWMRNGPGVVWDGPKIGATVGLYREGDLSRPIVEAQVEGIGGEFAAFSAVLSNPDFEGRATFAVSVGPGRLLNVDALSLMPKDHIEGWRKGTIEGLKRVWPRIIRFPGGCYATFYNWRDGIGPQDERRPRESLYWGGIEYNDVGTAEFVNLCRLVGAEPFLCVNVMTSTPDEAAEWVAYCNAGQEDRLGRLRARHGHPEPFGVKYWELDNEVYRKFGPLAYAKECVAFGEAMKEVDPTIRLVMVGYWRYREHLAQMLEIAGGHMDLVTDRSLMEEELREDLATIRAYNEKTGRDIGLCNTEWIAPTGDVSVAPDALNRQKDDPAMTLQNREIRWKYAMNLARQLLLFQRLGGDFVFSNFNNLANTWGQNVIECAKEGVYLSAAGRVLELMTRSPAAWPLRSEGLPQTPELVAQAAWDAKKKALVVVVINYRGNDEALTLDLSSVGLRPKTAQVTTLWAESLLSFNSLSQPDAVGRRDEERKLDGSAVVEISAPPYSVTHMVLK